MKAGSSPASATLKICWKQENRLLKQEQTWYGRFWKDVKASNKIEWNTDTAKRYWNMYGVPTGTNHTEIRLF